MAPANKGTRRLKNSVPRIDSISKVPVLEGMLGNGSVTFVLVFAEWCGACKKFMKNVWGPMCKKGAIHNRIAVRDDMVSKTSLSGTKFNYLPSIIVVNEKGDAETFMGPEGITNAMPTPRTEEEMVRVVNVSLTNTAAKNVRASNAPNSRMVSEIINSAKNGEQINVKSLLNLTPTKVPATNVPATNVPATNVAPTEEVLQANQEANAELRNQLSKTPEGIVYMPTPQAAPQRGGLFKQLRRLFRNTRKRSTKN